MEVLGALSRASIGGDSPVFALIRRMYEDVRLRTGIELRTGPVFRKDIGPQELTRFYRTLVDLLDIAGVEKVEVCTDPCLLQLTSLTMDRKGDRTSP